MRGVVRDTAGVGVVDVGVLLKPGDRLAKTNSNGEFSFDGLAPRAYYVSLRRLGFEPFNGRIEVTADTTLLFTMSRRPQLLDTVVVADECSRYQYSGFLCRRQKGGGIFLTEADILATNPRFVADIFMGMKGFHVEPVATPYGPQRIVRPEQSRCMVQLVDGRYPVGLSLNDLVEEPTPLQGETRGEIYVGNLFGPTELLGVEIYPAGYQTPEEYAFRGVAFHQASRAMSGSGMQPKPRAVQHGTTERCVFVNYWTTGSLPKLKKKKQ